MLRGVVFDVDGTLADTLRLCMASFRHAFRRHGHGHLDRERILALFGPDERGVLRAGVGEGWERSYADFLAHFRERHEAEVRPIAGIAPMLRALRADGLRLGIVTARGEESVRFTLERLALADAVDALGFGDIDGPAKPRELRRVIAELGVRAEDVAYVGDTARDMHDAREVGAIPVGATWAVPRAADALRRAGAAFVAQSPEELLRWVRER